MKSTIAAPATLLEHLAMLFPDSSRTTIRQMLQGNRVRVNGEAEINAKRMLQKGDTVTVLSRAEAVSLPPTLTLLHDDADLMVVIKANGLLTVPSATETENTAEALLNDYLAQKGGGRVHVVHRLDRETSGVLVFAKNFKTREALKEKFAAHDINRIYVAVIEGEIKPPSGTFSTNLLERQDLRMVSVKRHPDAKHAVTHYRTVKTNGTYSMLEVTLETGRKNQIRAHLSEAGHPIVGDRFYGAKTNPIGRLGLHAKLLGFVHPATGKQVTFTAPVPRPFEQLFGSDVASSSAPKRSKKERP